MVLRTLSRRRQVEHRCERFHLFLVVDLQPVQCVFQHLQRAPLRGLPQHILVAIPLEPFAVVRGIVRGIQHERRIRSRRGAVHPLVRLHGGHAVQATVRSHRLQQQLSVLVCAWLGFGENGLIDPKCYLADRLCPWPLTLLVAGLPIAFVFGDTTEICGNCASSDWAVATPELLSTSYWGDESVREIAAAQFVTARARR